MSPPPPTMQILFMPCGLYFIVTLRVVVAFVPHTTYSFLSVNSTERKCNNRGKPQGHGYGKDKCPCVGIDNLRGYFASNLDFYHVQYPLEAGASCSAWDKGVHPECSGEPVPNWCRQKWCFVDPCECELDEAPKRTNLGVTYQGGPAFYSYKTCDDFDFYTLDHNPNACPIQKDAVSCTGKPDCTWDGSTCKDKIVAEVCAKKKHADPHTYGKEGCRCVGFGGRKNGRAVLAINDHEEAVYDSNVGSVCQAWESTSHPECLKTDGTRPKFCDQRWCYVDPCSCDTLTPPKTVMSGNMDQRFQGKTVYWSYETCGSVDEWTSTLKSEYCVTQTTEASCNTMEKCTWTGKNCVGRALKEICTEQKSSGVLGIEVFSSGVRPILGFFTFLVSLFMA